MPLNSDLSSSYQSENDLNQFLARKQKRAFDSKNVTRFKGKIMKDTLTTDILSSLIAFDTTSSESNLALMQFVQSFLAEHNVDSRLVYNQEKSKANLYATIGPQDKPGVMLSGHTDTVPVTGQNWTQAPYQLTKLDNRYYGRGTSDMKGFVAAVLASVPDMQAHTLNTPIHLAFSYDEEIGCVGVRKLIENLKEQTIKPAICIIGEPTSMQVVTSHKGKIAAHVKVIGKECHSGMAPMGINAINYAARLIHWLEQAAIQRKLSGPFDANYDIPYSTVHTGIVNGGQALNIVPNFCEFTFEMRNIAKEDPFQLLTDFKAFANELIKEMKEISEQCDIQIELITQYPGLSTSETEEVVSYVRNLAQSHEKANINFGTEGGLFSQELNIPTVVCGPGSMAQGHKPDEFIEADQLAQCDLFLQKLIQSLKQAS